MPAFFIKSENNRIERYVVLFSFNVYYFYMGEKN